MGSGTNPTTRSKSLKQALQRQFGFRAVLWPRPLCACARCDDPLSTMIFWLPAPTASHVDAPRSPRRSGHAFQGRYASAMGQEWREADDIQAALPARTGPEQERLHRQGLHGHLRTGPKAPGFDPMVKGANAQAGVGTRPVPTRPTGMPCAGTTVTGSCEQPPVIRPSSTPGECRLKSKRRLRGCPKHRRIVREHPTGAGGDRAEPVGKPYGPIKASAEHDALTHRSFRSFKFCPGIQ